MKTKRWPDKHTSFLAQVNQQTVMHSFFFSDQSCIHVENGCFFADPSCERYNISITLFIFDLKQHELGLLNIILLQKPVNMTIFHVTLAFIIKIKLDQ